jgi:radical SAM superfamily enzyme YgiQ (UPF0313 family)
MSRIIFLSDIFDVKNQQTMSQSTLLDEENRKKVYFSELNSLVGKDGHKIGNYGVANKYNFWSRYLGPYVVASSIKQHIPEYDVVVLDYFTKLDNFFEVFEQLVTDDLEYIALSLTFLHNPFNPRQGSFNLWFTTHEELCEWFKKLKSIAPNAKIIVGGALVDTFFKTFITGKSKKPLPKGMVEYIDYAFHGYSEETIIKFLKNEIDPQDIFERETVKFIDQPLLAGKGAIITTNKWEKNYAIQPNEWLPLEISKGCRFGCKFCFYDHSGTVIKEGEHLRNELIYNYEHFGTVGYTLTDDTVNDSMAKIDMMYDVITSLPFKIEWIAYTRPDMFHKFPQMLDKMLKMGCRGMFLGIETFNHRAAKIAGKGLHPDKIKDIIKWLKETAGDDIFILASFIIGLVGETEESLMETVYWLRDQRYLAKAQYEILFISDAGGRSTNDFSERKEKYGFKKLEWHPEYYWEHETLDLHKCREIAQKWEDVMADHPYTQFERHANFNTNFWAYPRVRSLGYTHLETVKILTAKEVPVKIYQQNVEWIDNYHLDVLKRNVK